MTVIPRLLTVELVCPGEGCGYVSTWSTVAAGPGPHLGAWLCPRGDYWANITASITGQHAVRWQRYTEGKVGVMGGEELAAIKAAPASVTFRDVQALVAEVERLQEQLRSAQAALEKRGLSGNEPE